jgi:hypothetical protein
VEYNGLKGNGSREHEQSNDDSVAKPPPPKLIEPRPKMLIN